MVDAAASLVSTAEPAIGFRLLELELDKEIDVRPGQFTMLRPSCCNEPLLRRAFAIYRVLAPNRICVLFQVLGRGTKALAQLKPGDQISTLAPLGNCWIGNEDNQQAASPLPKKAIVVSGGIGSASVLMLAEELKRKKIDTHLFFGAASESAAIGCGLTEFRDLNIPIEVTSDDGSLGEKGFVTAPLERYLLKETGSGTSIYSCGPWVMMKRVAEIAASFRIPCFVSLEAPMSCGFGVCVGCVVAVKPIDDSPYSKYKRVCVDGTIFPAETVDWDVQSMSH